jgi:hypothetical protein
VEQTNPEVAIIDIRMPPTHTVNVIVTRICHLRNACAAQPQLAHETARRKPPERLGPTSSPGRATAAGLAPSIRRKRYG